ncbi:hypothetical protein SHKM778_47130 [Streptomyces sp. KM77-8]|uniref:Uncharacterized protein n=1 Tax=Streptomyces haneummycinicus TaxID=3074435 RepID=A0AAT9HLM0_9ACTN
MGEPLARIGGVHVGPPRVPHERGADHLGGDGRGEGHRVTDDEVGLPGLGEADEVGCHHLRDAMEDRDDGVPAPVLGGVGLGDELPVQLGEVDIWTHRYGGQAGLEHGLHHVRLGRDLTSCPAARKAQASGTMNM